MRPCIAAWAPAWASFWNSWRTPSGVGGKAGDVTTVKRAENRRSLAITSGRRWAKLPSSGNELTRVNSAIAIPSFLEPPRVTFKKTSAPWEWDGRGPRRTSPPSARTSRLTTTIRRVTASPLIWMELEAEVDAQGGCLELGRERREGARLGHRPEGRLIVERNARAPLQAGLLDRAVPADLEQDRGPLSAASRGARGSPSLADLRLDLAKVIRERDIAHIEADAAGAAHAHVGRPEPHGLDRGSRAGQAGRATGGGRHRGRRTRRRLGCGYARRLGQAGADARGRRKQSLDELVTRPGHVERRRLLLYP